MSVIGFGLVSFKDEEITFFPSMLPGVIDSRVGLLVLF